ncbi:MAG: hypothetical protein WD250_03450 [Egibacteraceae bacterium]
MVAPSVPVALGVPRSAVLGTVVAKAAELVTLVALGTIVPRVLGPVDYGRFSVLLTIVTIGTGALALGGTALQARFVPAVPLAQRPALAYAVAARLVRVRGGQLLGLAAVVGALVVWDPVTFPPVSTTLTFVALTVAVLATLGCQAGLGLGRTAAWNARYPVHNAVLVLALVWLYPRAGVPGTAVALVLAACGMSGVGVVAARGLRRPSGGADPLPDAIRRFGRLQGTGWALSQIAQRGGVLAVALLAGSTVETGYAALAIGTALPATYAVLALFTVTLPHLSATGADADGVAHVGHDAHGRGEPQLRRLAGAILALLVPATLAVAFLLPSLTAGVFGADYAPAARTFAPALALVVLSPLQALLIQVAALRLRADVTTWSALLGLVAFLGVAVIFVPRIGATGATAATSIAAAVTVAVAGRRLPGAVGRVLGITSFAAAATVVALALAVTR